MAADVKNVADAMYEFVKVYAGKKRFKDGDLIKEMIGKFREGECVLELCKLAIRDLMESGRCVYTYFGGSFIEIPHQEGAAMQ